MRQIAIYGKGGIGKSMVSSHISYALAKKGLKVLHVGCDPKHDSTRLLLKGRMPDTVLETLRNEDFKVAKPLLGKRYIDVNAEQLSEAVELL